jgi:SNF2 family DNA or RNA helicase
MDYQYKSKPYEHQDICFRNSRDQEVFAILFEMGAGKSKVLVDTAAYLYSLGRVNCLVILAPNGVHKKWLAEDIPFSLPDHIEYKAAVWESGNKESVRKCEDLFTPGQYLRILCANIEGMSYEALPKFLQRLLNATDAIVGVDESTRIKTPSASRTKNLMKLRKMMKYRRILAGDAVVNSPFDLFSQFGFLDEDILGYSYPAFKAEHAEMLSPTDPLLVAIMRKTKARFAPQIAAKNKDGTTKYKNLDKLKERIAPYSMRVTKAECLDLPPKIYEKRYFKLTGKHRMMYDQLVNDSRFELNDKTVPILHKLTLYLRLQQCVSGFMVDEEGHFHHLYEKHTDNPRIAALLDFLEDVEGSVIIWCRFQEEIRTLNKVLGPENCAMYYGEVNGKQRQENLDEFKSGEKKYLLGTAQAGGIGLNLVKAATAVYYSNTFNGGERWQSEDRCHRIGQEAESVLYIDLEAEDTIDSKIIGALRAKKDISDFMLELSNSGQKLV